MWTRSQHSDSKLLDLLATGISLKEIAATLKPPLSHSTVDKRFEWLRKKFRVHNRHDLLVKSGRVKVVGNGATKD